MSRALSIIEESQRPKPKRLLARALAATGGLPTTAHDVADRLGVRATVVLRALKHLASSGYVVRSGDAPLLFCASSYVLKVRELRVYARGVDADVKAVNACFRDAARVPFLWFTDRDIAAFSRWAGAREQMFCLKNASAAKRQRIAAWYVVFRALGARIAGRHLPMSLATNP